MATRRYILALLSALAALPLAVQAEDGSRIAIGANTENILAMQREGKTAGAPQPVAGEVATRAYHRYLESFAKPMPEFKETVATSTPSGSSGN